MANIRQHIQSLCVLIFSATTALSAPPEHLVTVSLDTCNLDIPGQCRDRDAIIFVHGIHGGTDTFAFYKNKKVEFDWPLELSRRITSEIGQNFPRIDVYKLNYETAMLTWARDRNPSFEKVAADVFAALKPVRLGGYRSIGFVAHSLGGNVVSTYVHYVKSKLGHPQRSQNAFIITLATPVLGSQIADLGSALKSRLFMSDPLLESLKRENLYLKMLQEFRVLEEDKEGRYICRPVNLHAAVEEKYLGPILVVRPASAAQPISDFVKSPVVGFPRDHRQMAKPRSHLDDVYLWVSGRIKQEYQRISSWEDAHRSLPADRQLCERMEYVPERP